MILKKLNRNKYNSKNKYFSIRTPLYLNQHPLGPNPSKILRIHLNEFLYKLKVFFY